MAKGGFSYTHVHIDQSLTTPESALTNLVNALDGHDGWTLNNAVSTYVSRAAWASLEHSGGGQIVFLWVGDDSGNPTFIDGSNYYFGTSLQTSVFEFSMMVAYIPPGGGVLGADPTAPGFIPAGGFLLHAWPGVAEGNVDGTDELWHFITRNGTICIVWQDNSASITMRSVFLAGPDIITEFAQTGDTFGAAQIGWTYSGGPFPTMATSHSSPACYGQCFDATGTTRLTSIRPGWNNFSEIHEPRPPYYTERIILYKSDGTGVSPTSGMKGFIDPDIMRGGANRSPAKRQFDSGNFIHLDSGILMGWDPGLGNMVS